MSELHLQIALFLLALALFGLGLMLYPRSIKLGRRAERPIKPDRMLTWVYDPRSICARCQAVINGDINRTHCGYCDCCK